MVVAVVVHFTFPPPSCISMVMLLMGTSMIVPITALVHLSSLHSSVKQGGLGQAL